MVSDSSLLIVILVKLPLILFNTLIQFIVGYPKVSLVVLFILSGVDQKILNIYINLFTYLIELISIYIVIGLQIIYLARNLFRVNSGRISVIVYTIGSCINKLFTTITLVNCNTCIKIFKSIFILVVILVVFYIILTNNNRNVIRNSISSY